MLIILLLFKLPLSSLVVMVTVYGSSDITMAGSGSPVVCCCLPHSCEPPDRDRSIAHLRVCVLLLNIHSSCTNVQLCNELFVLLLSNVLDVLEFNTLYLWFSTALTQRVISILPKKRLRSIPFQTSQESWRTAMIQTGQVSMTEIRFILMTLALSIHLSL